MAMACESLTSSSFTGHPLTIPKSRTPNIMQIKRAFTRASTSASVSHNSHSHSLHEWKTLCATINGQVENQLMTTKSNALADGTDFLPVEQAVKGVDSLAFLQMSSLVPANKPEALNNQLPRPLSVSSAGPAPMHGSALRVAYQGVPGAYSEAAAGKAYPDCETVPCDQFEVTFQSLELWLTDRAVLPVENSLGGSIHRNYDLLLRHHLHIVGEVQLPVHHCLLAMPGVRKEDIRRVISHPQALAQCENTLTRLALNASREAVDDTAGAAQFIAENGLRDTAAIASARAAEIYGMNILVDGIQDDSGNVTRFVMLAREPIIPRLDKPFKTSIVFATEETTGSLFKVLSAFAFRNINLTKIESRPQRQKPLRTVDGGLNNGKAKYFEYLFYIDFEASMADERAQNALREVQEFTSFLRVLGSYPMDITPSTRCPPSL
ncbi:hypothetical protein GOP47_0020423 [Adiantum capillus-veneris]|uniref:Arogenate dehydratase n=1 Tax=Adiantum capillus-veneris TaxID=13818 RepID=A0A9D4UCY1_ADICA|nr:hypothetical protein GOP47_0020423 [Adiantum capillus-veneris]